jgi:hemoglobin-like flavoprotein
MLSNKSRPVVRTTLPVVAEHIETANRFLSAPVRRNHPELTRRSLSASTQPASRSVRRQRPVPLDPPGPCIKV